MGKLRMWYSPNAYAFVRLNIKPSITQKTLL